jgi:hypothetical protein
MPLLPLMPLLLADRFSASESTNSQPQVFSTQRTPPIIIIIIITLIGTATHHAAPSVLHCTAAAACHLQITQPPCCANTMQQPPCSPAFSLHCTVS